MSGCGWMRNCSTLFSLFWNISWTIVTNCQSFMDISGKHSYRHTTSTGSLDLEPSGGGTLFQWQTSRNKTDIVVIFGFSAQTSDLLSTSENSCSLMKTKPFILQESFSQLQSFKVLNGKFSSVLTIKQINRIKCLQWSETFYVYSQKFMFKENLQFCCSFYWILHKITFVGGQFYNYI